MAQHGLRRSGRLFIHRAVRDRGGEAVCADYGERGGRIFAAGDLYCRAESGPGTIALIEATPDGWKETGRFDQPSRSRDNSWPQPVIADGKLFIRDHDILLCYDVKGK